ETVARRVLRLVSHDAQADAALDRVVERRRGRAARDRDLAGAERRHRLGGGVEADELDREAFFLEVAALVGDEERRVARGADRADGEFLCDAAARRKQRCCQCGESDNGFPVVRHARLPRYLQDGAPPKASRLAQWTTRRAAV